MNQKDIEIIRNLQTELDSLIGNMGGPFLAAIYDKSYNLIAKAQNSVLIDNCSMNHAEVNAVKLAEDALKSYNLAPYDLGIYVTSEPCIMCLGAILWSGIKRVYFSVPSPVVEKITGFNEGYKPNWIEKFKEYGIEAYGGIEEETGIKVLEKYVRKGGIIYKPE